MTAPWRVAADARRMSGAAGAVGPVLDLVAASALWGGMYVVSAATFDRVPPLTLGLFRLVVGVAVLGVAFGGRIGFVRGTGRRVLATGAIVALTMALQFVGTSLTGGAEGALLTTTTPAFVLLLGAGLDREPVRPAAWLGVLVALVGVGLVATRNGGYGTGPAGVIGGMPAGQVGDLLLVASAATWALFSWVGRPLVRRVGAFRAILQASVVAIVLLAPLVPLELAGSAPVAVDGPTLGAIAYLGVGATAVAWSLWYRGYAASPATASAAAFFAQPLVGGALGALVLGEALGVAFLGGAALIVAGVLLIVLPGVRRAVRPRA